MPDLKGDVAVHSLAFIALEPVTNMADRVVLTGCEFNLMAN